MPNIEPFSCRFEAKGFDCGYGGPLSPRSMANFLQETAGEHATRLGFGVEALRERGLTWMLSRMDLRADGLPRAAGALVARTWPSGIERLFALRDIELRADGASGAPFVRGLYAYLVVDIAARRPIRPERFFEGDPPVWEPDAGGPRHCVESHGFRVPAAAGSVISFAQRAMPRHIDYNGHVNNAHLVDWLADAVPRSRRGAAGSLAALRVEFLAEALEGQDLAVSWGLPAEEPESWPEGLEALVTEIAGPSGPVARALVAWR